MLYYIILYTYYIYIYICTSGKGQMGSALIGSLQISCFFDGGTFWVLPLTYYYLPKSARAYLFPQSVKSHYLFKGHFEFETSHESGIRDIGFEVVRHHTAVSPN